MKKEYNKPVCVEQELGAKVFLMADLSGVDNHSTPPFAPARRGTLIPD